MGAGGGVKAKLLAFEQCARKNALAMQRHEQARPDHKTGQRRRTTARLFREGYERAGNATDRA